MAARLQGRALPGIAVGAKDGDRSMETPLERSPSLLGTGMRGEGHASGAGPGYEASGAGGGGRSLNNMPNSRSMGMMTGGGGGTNPSGLFSCR